MFRGWTLMKADTGLSLLLSALSLALSQEPRSGQRSAGRGAAISRLAGAVVFLIAGLVLAEYVFHVSLGIDTLLAADPGSPHPGRMSPQTAAACALLSIVAIFIRVESGLGALAIDVCACGFCTHVLVIVTGYAFGVLRLFGLSPSTVVSPQTLLSLMLLALVIFLRRAERGFLSVFVGAGVGSRIARVAAPFTLLVPFLLEAGRGRILQTGLFSPEYSAAIVTVLAALIGFGLLVTLAWRIDGLEENIRDLSLRDELTKLYNRRGFFLLAERGLQLARRAQSPFSVLFLDVDGLKDVNDTLGHDSGSALLREMADVLTANFRETEVIARLGGDEFVVAGAFSEAEIDLAAKRLEGAAAQREVQGRRAYRLSFSAGHATRDGARRESLEELISRADAVMYAAKRNKKAKREA
jgi:diguanylate cyclase (GGDEF)-like protein